MAIYLVQRVMRVVVRLLVLAMCIVCSLLFESEPLSQRAETADVGRRPPGFGLAETRGCRWSS